MDNLFVTLPVIGDLYYHHIYLFYEEPQIFSCITSTMQLYFVVAISSENDVNSAWLAVPISSGKLLKAEKNAIEIREILTDPEGLILEIQKVQESFCIRDIAPDSLTDDLLPEQGELLDFAEAMEILPPVETPAAQAAQEMRDIIEISLEKNDSHITEISCSALGDMLNDVQQLIYAIAFKNGGLRGSIPRKIKEDCQLCATGMFAASVGVRLKSYELCDLAHETPLTETLRDFNRLFRISGSKELLREFLATQSPRVAVKYRALLNTLLVNQTGVKINNASPNNETFTKHFSTQELSSNLALIDSEIKEIVERNTFYGQLVGVNVERCKFEFTTTDKEKITGKISSELRDSIFSVPQQVEADIEIRIGTDSITHSEKLLYTLMEIRPLVLQDSSSEAKE